MTVSNVSLSACGVDEVAATAAGVTGLRGAACWRVAGASTGAATGLGAAAGAVGPTVAVRAGEGQPCHHAYDQTRVTPGGTRKADHGVSSPRIRESPRRICTRSGCI